MSFLYILDAADVLVSTTTALREQRTAVESRALLVESFLTGFQLNKDEMAIWKRFESKECTVELSLFVVFYRMIQIRYQCKLPSHINDRFVFHPTNMCIVSAQILNFGFILGVCTFNRSKEKP